VVLYQFLGWASSIVDFQLTSIQLSTIHVLWFLLKFHPLQHSLVDDFNMSSDTPYPPELLFAHICCHLSSFITTTIGGYFVIHISSQTTKKEVSENPHLRTITPRKLLSLYNTTTFAPVWSQVLHNSRTWHNRKPFTIVTAFIYRLQLTLHRRLFATNPSPQRLGESTQKSIGFRNKVHRKPLAVFWESQQVCVKSYIGNHANFLGFSECR